MVGFSSGSSSRRMGRSLEVPRHAGNAGSLPRKNPQEVEKLPLHRSCSSQGHPWSITQGHLLESVLALVSVSTPGEPCSDPVIFLNASEKELLL